HGGGVAGRAHAGARAETQLHAGAQCAPADRGRQGEEPAAEAGAGGAGEGRGGGRAGGGGGGEERGVGGVAGQRGASEAARGGGAAGDPRGGQALVRQPGGVAERGAEETAEDAITGGGDGHGAVVESNARAARGAGRRRYDRCDRRGATAPMARRGVAACQTG